MEDGSQYLHPSINNAIVKSEIEGGVYTDKMENGDYLMQTQNTMYTITKKDNKFTIMGHHQFCPIPRDIYIVGSRLFRNGSMIKINYIGRGMFFEGIFPDAEGCFVTSEIKDITKL